MKRNGTTSAGHARWRCPSSECGASRTVKHQRDGDDLIVFLDWLFSKHTQGETGIKPRTFRHHTRWCWDLWPPVPLVDEIHHVIHVDGIHLHRQAVVLIAIADGYVIGWYVARRETSAGWINLMARIAPPDVVICDGGGGLLKALRITWPNTRVQRCLFHVCMNVSELTGPRPRLEAGKRLRKLAIALSRVTTQETAADWLVAYNQWEQDFAGFLDEQSRYEDGSIEDTHQRLVKARRMIRKRIRDNHLFTFLDHELTRDGPIPATNNQIESWNARLRDMMRQHRGLRLIRRINAICWWCHQHSERPQLAAWLATNAITDQHIEQLYATAWESSSQGAHETYGIPNRYGTGINWNEFHTTTPYPNGTN